jgi:hypothetical protein
MLIKPTHIKTKSKLVIKNNKILVNTTLNTSKIGNSPNDNPFSVSEDVLDDLKTFRKQQENGS